MRNALQLCLNLVLNKKNLTVLLVHIKLKSIKLGQIYSFKQIRQLGRPSPVYVKVLPCFLALTHLSEEVHVHLELVVG